MIMRRALPLSIVILTGLLMPPPAPAQVEAPPDYSEAFEKMDVMIPMRDGAELHTEIYIPRDADGPLPFIMERTPYGLGSEATGYSRFLGRYAHMHDDGYIFVFQDLRGRFTSTGEYQTTRPPRDPDDPDGVDETTDTWDSIEWLVNNVPGNNGKLGFAGISYGGFTTMRAIMEPHRALVAASPQATCADMFLGDDLNHHGAFRLQYNFTFMAMMERGKGMSFFEFDQHDQYEWFLDLGPLSNVDRKIFLGEVPSWNQFIAHPNLDDYWEFEICGVLPFLDEVTVPTLNVIGWFDAEDFYGPLEVYKKLEKKDSKNWNYLVAGPWTHGSWARDDGRKLLEFDFGSDTSTWYRDEIEARWFAYWLHGRGELELPKVLAFQTGANEWERLDSWPPEGVEPKKLYLREDGRVSFEAPGADDGAAFDSYVSDPAKPVPYLPRPIGGWEDFSTWQLVDQRFVDRRPDVLTWESEPLEQDLAISGDIIANLFASTTGTDIDWIVKLIDVYPEDYEANPNLRGYQLMVAGEIFRGRFRNSFREAEPIPAGEVLPWSFSLRDRNHRFKKGHRIMIQIQSTWYPLVSRNPQTFVPNIFLADEEDYRPATQRVYRSKRYPSHVTVLARAE
jgi:putative CocE/NonD family hydrolase